MTINEAEKDPEEEEEPRSEVTTPAPSSGDKTEVKVVVHMIGNSACIGVQQKGTDPVFSSATGTREEIMTAALKSLVEAEEKWKTVPKNPKADLPKPAVNTAPTKAAAGTTATKATPKSQPSFF